jgi:hypothetical protein
MKQICFTQADYYRILSPSWRFVDLMLEAVTCGTHAPLYNGMKTVCRPQLSAAQHLTEHYSHVSRFLCKYKCNLQIYIL